MRIESDKIYIDYLDYTMSSLPTLLDPSVRIRFDLLLFSQAVLCISVPACVKLESTTELLMKLTPFWNNGKIRLILDRKHRNNPWNYFDHRNRVLEKAFSDEQLVHHFEYSAYGSLHTKIFYDSYIRDYITNKNSLYITKIFDTDELFRQSVITQSENICDKICAVLPVNQAIHMGKIINDLVTISEDRNCLFQRTAVETKLIDMYKADKYEIDVIRRILDKGFEYANGISSYAAPISQIANRLTSLTLIPLLKAVDMELYGLICHVSWPALYELSNAVIWLDFIDHLNALLLLYRDCRLHKQTLFPPSLLEFGIVTTKLIEKLYETAIESLQRELLISGIPLTNMFLLKEYSESMFEGYLEDKHKYWVIIEEINALLPAIKTFIRSLSRQYKGDTLTLEQQGYIITLDC